MKLIPIMKMVSGNNRYPQTKVFAKIAEVPVDDQDFDLAQFTYTLPTVGYPRRTVGRERVYLHREIAVRAGLDTSNEIDHKDRNPLNCQRSNLQYATRRQNLLNSNLRKDSKLKRKWVHPCASGGNYWVRVGGNYLGTYSDLDVAAQVADAEAVRLYGEYACTNKKLGLIG